MAMQLAGESESTSAAARAPRIDDMSLEEVESLIKKALGYGI
jgi:hypothetical protein